MKSDTESTEGRTQRSQRGKGQGLKAVSSRSIKFFAAENDFGGC